MSDIPSFIGKTRREQIITAAIEVLEEIGYIHISLAKIAKKAKISTGLISYHFSGKEDVMNQTLYYLIQKEWQFINEKVQEKKAPLDRLYMFIEASLLYQKTHRTNQIALIEIIFHARSEDHIPYYLIEGNEEDDLLRQLLKAILLQGQESKVFASFHIDAVTTIIQGAISEYMFSTETKLDADRYASELKYLVHKMIT
ncbi:TetR/AcrR family transcriptional regulator [Virgibacillus salexigens]|uniref:Transcriptional regulator BetI n=1 Tax=Virgibacillus massiliensis TaxID=1462526 RepID=A0A024QGJ3_9BACI|nr:TetR/AcrR family transcriptional regulator [Virgibacillus massiliensis]MYL43553.1 TetR family transcriptional regulator [Virgibacillus massiliensis]CDQ41320.1 transcriptional regulator BetI [Virgibacillus massiliensis]